MLRKRTRSHQKDQMGHLVGDAGFQPDVLGQKHKMNSFFNVPGLFVGFSPKASDSDSVRSPTSPLDFRILSNFGNPFRSPRSPSHEGHQKSWDCTKVGLSIIDTLDDDAKQSGKTLRSSDSKNILFGPQIMRIKTPDFQTRIGSFEAPKSLPNNHGVFPHTQIKPSNLQMGNSDVHFGIGEATFEPEAVGKFLSCSLDSGRLTSLMNRSTDSSSGNFGSGNGINSVSSPPDFSGGRQILGNSSSATKMSSIPIPIGSAHDFIGSFSASEIELSEDYTCVKTYGPNPKTTHIFGDCILDCHNNNLDNLSNNEEQKIQLPQPSVTVICSEIPSPYPFSDFLSFCFSCKKKLEGEDIYMYRGEKAFCSWDCRSQEILIEEAMEKARSDSPENTPEPNPGEEIPKTSIFIAT